MPQLQTYTASGQVRGGPVAAPTDASVLNKPALATEYLGRNLQQAGSDLEQISEQRKKEVELQWATESISQYKRVLAEREVADLKNPTETQGQDFKTFADQQMTEYLKAAPSAQAANLFKAHALDTADTAYKRSLFAGEQTRLVNVDTANEKTTANIVATAKATQQFEGDPEAVAKDTLAAVKTQSAYIDTVYGKNAKNFADKMQLHLYSEVALATAATNPNFARQLVEGAPIDERSKLTLQSHIDTINSSAMQLQQYKLMTGIKDSFSVADGKMMAGQEVDPPAQLPRSAFDIFGKDGERQFLEYQRAYKEKADTISAFVGIKGLNANSAQAVVNDMRMSGDPAKADAAEKLQHVVNANAHLQKTDAVQFLENSNDKLKTDAAVIPTLPDEMQGQAAKWYYNDLIQYQGHPVPGASDPEKYLGNDIVHILSADKADKLKQELIGGNRDQQLNFVDHFADRFGGDNHLANMAWHDMIALGKEKIPMGLQFAGIINNVQTRKEFLSSQFAAKADMKLDDESVKAYYAAIKADPNWVQFSQAWKGPALERAGGMDAALMSLVAYAQSKSAGQTAEQASKEAIQKVIVENYGFAQVHGQSIAIPRIGPKGNLRTDDEIKDMSRTMQLALHDIDVRDIQLNDDAGRTHFPNFPPTGDIKKPEDAQYVQDAITRNGFWVAEPSGEVMKLFVAEPGREPFAVLDKTNQPLQFKIDDLPGYYETSTAQMGIYSALTEMPTGLPVRAPRRASESYPLQSAGPAKPSRIVRVPFESRGTIQYRNEMMMEPSIQTNWPSRGTYYQGTRRFGVE